MPKHLILIQNTGITVWYYFILSSTLFWQCPRCASSVWPLADLSYSRLPTSIFCLTGSSSLPISSIYRNAELIPFAPCWMCLLPECLVIYAAVIDKITEEITWHLLS